MDENFKEIYKMYIDMIEYEEQQIALFIEMIGLYKRK